MITDNDVNIAIIISCTSRPILFLSGFKKEMSVQCAVKSFGKGITWELLKMKNMLSAKWKEKEGKV